MEGKLHQTLILLLFLVFFSSYQLHSSAYTLPDKYFINCGSNINVNVASRTYVGDMNSGLVSFTKQKSFATGKQASKTPSALYRTARIFGQKSSYVLEIDSNGSYLVRLHFFGPVNLSAAAFDVSASGFVLLHNFTVQNSNNTAVVKEFILSIPIGNFSINFVPQGSSFAFINAIEVFPAPPDFINDEDSKGNKGIMNISIGPDRSSSVQTAFLNGVEIMEMVGISDFVTVKPKHKYVFVIVGLVLGGLVLVCVFGGLLCSRLKCRKSKSVGSPEWLPLTAYKGSTRSNRKMPQQSKLNREGATNTSYVPDLNLGLNIPFFEIQLATSNFDPKLLIGKGGFGDVYRGTLRTGIKVAVKRSKSGSGQGLPEFQTEIMVLSRIRHLHLVSLIGYCDEMSEMILVYEFMEKGTLREHLYNSERPSLPWKQRLEICIGAARGLNYLHKGATGGIIHRDVKSTNILLDENFVTKVADFGLSRLGPSDQSHVSTVVKGTFGYLDPDYFSTQQLTEKSDVYSFGVVLLEVLCARAVIDPTLPRDQVNLVEWGMLCKKKGLLEQILDPSIKHQINPHSLRKFADIAEKCLQEDAANRPTMSDVAWDLEYALQLQQTAVVQEPHEDSMSNVSAMLMLPVFQSLPSMTAPFHSDDTSIIREDESDSVPLAGEAFSQLRSDDTT